MLKTAQCIHERDCATSTQLDTLFLESPKGIPSLQTRESCYIVQADLAGGCRVQSQTNGSRSNNYLSPALSVNVAKTWYENKHEEMREISKENYCKGSGSRGSSRPTTEIRFPSIRHDIRQNNQGRSHFVRTLYSYQTWYAWTNINMKRLHLTHSSKFKSSQLYLTIKD